MYIILKITEKSSLHDEIIPYCIQYDNCLLMTFRLNI